MSLDSILTIANSGLSNVNQQLSVVSQNVTNAGTTGYTHETANSLALTAGDYPMGVRTLPATRDVNTQLQKELNAQTATVANLTVTSNALSNVDAALGTVAAGSDLSSLLGSVRNAFSTLSSDPSSTTQQVATVNAASALTRGINALSSTYTQERQNAQSSLESEVTDLNTTLSDIGKVSDQIISLKALGQSTATLEDQRDVDITKLSTLIGAQAAPQTNGDVLMFTSGGLSLDTRATTGPFSMQNANMQPGSAAPGLMMNGVDVTAQVALGQGGGGQIGANITLRDTTMPTYQAQIDEFSHDLSMRFQAVGLNLFTNGATTVPAAAATNPVQAPYVGLAASIQVNPTVSATPSLIRDGTAGAATGESGYQVVINNVLNEVLGSTATPGVNAPATTGLGINGNLNAGFATPTDLADFATTVVSTQSTASANATTALTNATSVQTGLQTKLNSASGVNVDTELSRMISLQNSYGANAKVITAVQQMWSDLMNMVQ